MRDITDMTPSIMASTTDREILRQLRGLNSSLMAVGLILSHLRRLEHRRSRSHAKT